ncbi:unnamed protein product [Phytophthora fragariaefolia]|uniref:Unnamed protein product n=1 Tax=Phytophthora fragariaefolia TaxID=1490495 RepID=A0A9W7CVB7_9STRA|nr:unnamed protein product [Phytophthora fragariaefolia]
MADAYRLATSAYGSAKAVYGAKGKAPRLAAPKNQQPPSSVLPRIDRRGELPHKPNVPSLLLSPNAAKNGGLSILLPPKQPSSKETMANEEGSPTFHGDEFDGPNASTKAAWCTPRNSVPEVPTGVPTGAQVASFFAAPEANNTSEGSSIAMPPIPTMPTPLRLQTVEDSIKTDEERYRIDMEQLEANNSKFFEISMSANQHLEYMHNLLPNISETFDQTSYAGQLCPSACCRCDF